MNKKGCVILIKNLLHTTKHLTHRIFWYFTIVSFGWLSLFVTPNLTIASDLKEVISFAKSYETQNVGSTKEQLNETTEVLKKKLRKLTPVQPVNPIASFTYRYIFNTGEDLHHQVSLIESPIVLNQRMIVPVGTIAPPMFF